MKIQQKSAKFICIMLVLMMLVPDAAYAAVYKKEETVFVTLDASGAAKEKIVSDWLHTDTGKTQLNDISSLQNIVNVKSDESPVIDGSSVTWNVEGNDIYYSGTTDKNLPLDVTISYYLNGTQMTPEEIAGKSGQVSIKLNIKNNEKRNVELNGKLTTMYTPMTAVAIMSLPNDTFKNVNAENGMVISDGNNQIVAFICMPGLKESLNLDGYNIPELNDIDFPEELEVTAEATEFELGPIGIAATPELIDMDDLKKSEDFEEMRTNLQDLSDMQTKLDIIDPDRDIRSLLTDENRTDAARLLIDDLFDFYDMDKALFDILPDYVTEENIALYDRVKADLEDADIEYILDNQTLRDIPDRLTDENIEKSRLLVDDFDEIQTFDMKKLDDVTDVLDDYDDLEGMINRADSLVDKIDKNKANMDTLDVLSNYTKDITNLLDKIDRAGLDDLTNEDINIMFNALGDKKIGDASGVYLAMIDDNGVVAEQDRETIAGILQKAFASQGGSATTESAIQAQKILLAIQSGEPIGPQGTSIRDTVDGIIVAAVGSVASGSISEAKSEFKSMLNAILNLESKIYTKLGGGYKDKMKRSLRFLSDELMPDVRYFRDEYDKNKDKLDKAMDLMQNKEDVKYLTKWAHRLKGMKRDLDDNQDNVEILRDTLKQYDDPKVKHFKDKIPTLMDDMDEVRPILDSLKEKLEDPVLDKSFHSSPASVAQLLKMKGDLENNRDIAETLRNMMTDRNISMTRDIISTLDRFKAEGTVDEYMSKLDDADELFARKDLIVELSDDYSIFTEASQDAETKVKFVMKTDEIEKPVVVQPVVAQVQEEQGFLAWCKNLLAKIGIK